MTTREKIIKKLYTDLGIKVKSVHRCYPGRHQKSAGAWKWFAFYDIDLGSQFSMSECLKANNLIEYRNPITKSIEILIE